MYRQEKQSEIFDRSFTWCTKNWKKLAYIITACLGLLMCKSCVNTVPPGHVGVVVDMLGDSKGVEPQELHVGLHWIAPWKCIYQFPIFEQNHTWEGDREGFNFQTTEGMAVSADIGITFHLKPEAIPNIFAKYRRGMDEITHIFIRNFVRDAINKSASKMKIEDLYGSGKEVFFDEVERHIKSDLSPIGIDISRIYLIGRFHFPTNVIAALNAKIEATQRAQQRENELREAEAEAKKQIAKADGAARCAIVTAESEAKANNIVANSITAPLLAWQAVNRWDGKLPQVVSPATTMVPLK